MTQHHRHRQEYYVERPRVVRGRRWLFERNGQFGWGPKAIATRFRGTVDAKRAAAIATNHGGYVNMARLVHA